MDWPAGQQKFSIGLIGQSIVRIMLKYV